MPDVIVKYVLVWAGINTVPNPHTSGVLVFASLNELSRLSIVTNRTCAGTVLSLAGHTLHRIPHLQPEKTESRNEAVEIAPVTVTSVNAAI